MPHKHRHNRPSRQLTHRRETRFLIIAAFVLAMAFVALLFWFLSSPRFAKI